MYNLTFLLRCYDVAKEKVGMETSKNMSIGWSRDLKPASIIERTPRSSLFIAKKFFQSKELKCMLVYLLFYVKLVDCLEKCLICRHIRRFAD